MRGSRDTTDEEVVFAFLSGELQSARFGNAIHEALEANGGLALVRSADLTSLEENEARRRALASARGWSTGTGLFEGFPTDIAWLHATLTPDEIARIRFTDYSYWREITGGSRRHADVLATLRSGGLPQWLQDLGTDWCFEFAATIRSSRSLGDLIVVGPPNLDQLVVVEGHARLAALFVAGLEQEIEVAAYVGTSPNVDAWTLF